MMRDFPDVDPASIIALLRAGTGTRPEAARREITPVRVQVLKIDE
jgi:hypothetical protein